MTRIKPLLLGAYFIYLASVAYAGGAVSFLNVAGNVLYGHKTESEASLKTASAQNLFSVGQQIRVGNDSSALIKFGDAGSLSFKPDTSAVFADKFNGRAGLELKKGEIRADLDESISAAVDMSLAVLKFKNGAVSVKASEDGLINCINILRGKASVYIKSSDSTVKLSEGQNIVVKQKLSRAMKALPPSYYVDAFNVEEEELGWAKHNEEMAFGLDIYSLTKKLNSFCDKLDAEGKDILLSYDRLAAEIGSLSDVEKLKKSISVFGGRLAEADQYCQNAKDRIEEYNQKYSRRKKEKVSGKKEKNELVSSYAVNSLSSAVKRFSSIKVYFKDKLGDVGLNLQEAGKSGKLKSAAEFVSPLEEALNKAYAISEKVRKEAVTIGVTRKQEWYVRAVKTLSESMAQVAAVSAEIAKKAIVSPKDRKIIFLTKLSECYMKGLRTIRQALNIYLIEDDEFNYLNDLRDNIGFHMNSVMSAILTIKKTSGNTDADKIKKRRESEKLLNGYYAIKRQYRSAERICSRILREKRKTRYETQEMKSVEALWREIQDDFLRLGEESGILRQLIDGQTR